ncbi:hypothetical protein E1A91_A11G238900v1 [Gossypium mustelinum]|uniref:FAD dependent oxidoreductase domain-containing protein n=1 Tax=Gossypium mustelinum TaxID=34275 RepID=A0A5D2X9Z3_GOSMU|nr:hypothetical protein E1A91_A11G238900v1 [Gossypium mustelinum]
MAVISSASLLSIASLFRPIRKYPTLPDLVITATSICCLSSLSQPMDDRQQPESKKRVVVCGGGIIGVCTAYFLAKKGAAVTLIEKSSVACAASGKAGGFLALDWCDGGPVESLARASFNLHRSLSEELNGPDLYGYRPLTSLSITVTESGPSSPSGSKSSGDSTIPSWVDGPTRGPRTIGTTQTTAQVHPQLFTRTLLNTAVKKYGVEVVIGKLEQLHVEEWRVGSVVLEEGRVIESDSVVLSLGPWTGKFEMLASMFGVSGLKAHSIVLEPKDPGAITPMPSFLAFIRRAAKPWTPKFTLVQMRKRCQMIQSK